MAQTKRAKETGITHYSEVVEGDNGNWNWPARFHITDGYLNVTQFEDGKVTGSVLLTPEQVDAMIAFRRKHST